MGNSSSTRLGLPELNCRAGTSRPGWSCASFDSVKGDEGGQQDEPLFDVDLLDQNFQSMPLSPGVKLQAGDASLAGPELPLFGRRMRKSTFVEMDTNDVGLNPFTDFQRFAKRPRAAL
ncbi:hypothetical protein BBJ28_00007790 [Nothophytophthora sp. Chile5]|nr:hypothetical protein BBJ28_00007790 [Nothophytophthora sp. Chile5]